MNQTFFSSKSIKPPSWHGNASNKNYDNLSNSSSTALIIKAWGYTLFDNKWTFKIQKLGINIHSKNIFSLQVKHFFKSHQKGKKIGPTNVCNITKHSSVEVYPSIRVYFRLRILDFFIHFPSMSVLKADKYWKTERILKQDILKKLKFRQLCLKSNDTQ